jgi:hypothetical protein
MAISAIALLRLQTLSGLELKSLRVDRLDDAVLVYTNVDFANEPETLSQIVWKQVGDVLRAEHRDPRGIFFVPDVAPPKARTYDGVIEEIGEGGVWGTLPQEGSPLGAAAAAGGLGALLGGMLEQMPASVWESLGEAAQGRPGALEAASSQLRAAMAGSSELSDLANQLAGGLGGLASDPAIEAQLKAASGAGMPDLASLSQALGGSGVDLEKLMSQMQSAFASDPARAAELAERFFGKPSDADDDDDDERR